MAPHGSQLSLILLPRGDHLAFFHGRALVPSRLFLPVLQKMQKSFREVQLICRLLCDTDKWGIINRMKYHWGWINLRLLLNNRANLCSNSFNITRAFFSVLWRRFIFREDKVTPWASSKPAAEVTKASCFWLQGWKEFFFN